MEKTTGFKKNFGFGMMRFPMLTPGGKEVDIPMLTGMVDDFIARGFNYFDTAYFYYKSEEAVKTLLVDRYPRDSFFLTDKLPVSMLKSKAHQTQVFEEQLKKCGTEYFDLYLLHALGAGSYQTAKELDSFGFLSRLKKEGRVKNIGFSFHDTAEVLETILAENPSLDFVQLQINYLDLDDENIQSRKCHETALKFGVPIIVMEPVKGGALAKVPPDAEALFKSHSPEMSASSWAIRYAAGLPGVVMVLSGMSDTAQLNDNTGFMSDFRPLDEGEQEIVARAAEIIKKENVIPCTDCRYCVNDCPQDIPIPAYFRLRNEYKKAEHELVSRKKEYAALKKGRGAASDCIECGACEKRCPQKIEIIDCLKKVAAVFED